MKVQNPSVELLAWTKNPEELIEAAGRTCYKSEKLIDKFSAKRFCSSLIESGHHSVIEHASATVRIITDRGISHEIVRHRLASYSQESSRYCNYSLGKFDNECTFVKPPGMIEEQEKYWFTMCNMAQEHYNAMINSGSRPDLARCVLPNCLKTELIMTCNFREWRHFIKLRGSKHAHFQIRPIAYAVWRLLKHRAPSIFSDLDPICDDIMYEFIQSNSRKYDIRNHYGDEDFDHPINRSLKMVKDDNSIFNP